MAAENALGGFIAAEVARAEVDYKNFRDRAASLVSVASALATVLVGLLALAADKDEKVLPSRGAAWLVSAMLFLVVSTVFSLLIQIPSKVRASDPKELTDYVANHWGDADWDQSIAALEVQYLEDLRAANTTASRLFFVALLSQLFAVASLAVVAWRIFDFLT